MDNYTVTFTLISGAEFKRPIDGNVNSTKEEYYFKEPDGSVRALRKELIIGYHLQNEKTLVDQGEDK